MVEGLGKEAKRLLGDSHFDATNISARQVGIYRMIVPYLPHT